MYTNKKENDNGLVHWSSTDDSFIIENPDLFSCILPKYFKTKNYSSFIRQLNMYGFHKVKNNDLTHEYKHPEFKRGHLDTIRRIRRQCYDGVKTDNRITNSYKSLYNELQTLEKGHIDLYRSLNVISAQNKQLVDSNTELVVQWYLLRKEHELRVKKLVFIFFMLIEKYTPELLAIIRSSLAESSFLDSNHNSQTPNPYMFKTAIHRIVQKLIFNKNKTDSLLDNLLNLFSKLVTNGDKIEPEVLDDYNSTIDGIQKADKRVRHDNDRETNINDVLCSSPLNLDRHSDLGEYSNKSPNLFDRSFVSFSKKPLVDEEMMKFECSGFELDGERSSNSENESLM